jgi:hypothetical protein
MKNLVLIGSLLAATACSIANAEGPAAPAPPPAPSGAPVPAASCTRSGDVVFEQAQVSEQGVTPAGVPLWTTTVYAGGGWTRVDVDAQGKITRTMNGCVSPADVKTIRDDLARARWTITHADAACAAISATYVAYSSHGKHLWDQHICGIDTLDPVSQKALDEIGAIIARVTTPVMPPCCKP